MHVFGQHLHVACKEASIQVSDDELGSENCKSDEKSNLETAQKIILEHNKNQVSRN